MERQNVEREYPAIGRRPGHGFGAFRPHWALAASDAESAIELSALYDEAVASSKAGDMEAAADVLLEAERLRDAADLI